VGDAEVFVEPGVREKLIADSTVLEPVRAVGDPPAQGEYRDGGAHGPPEREQQIDEETEKAEAYPEHFALHGGSLALGRGEG
jgi:hypothetical protein